MSQKHTDFRSEVRDTIFKSGLTGVAATVLAVTLSSPAGLGGMIGTSLASGAGESSADDAYASLPAYPTPLTASEVSEIRGQLAATAASLALVREATDDSIEQVRSIAASAQLAPAPPITAAAPVLRLALSEPAPVVEDATSVAYSRADEAQPVDPNLELATLLFSYDSL